MDELDIRSYQPVPGIRDCGAQSSLFLNPRATRWLVIPRLLQSIIMMRKHKPSSSSLSFHSRPSERRWNLSRHPDDRGLCLFSMELDSWVLEQAREELEILEAQYPDRFDYLKLELKAFISQPGNPSQFSPFLVPTGEEEEEEETVSRVSTFASTQESSNRKRRRTVVRGSVAVNSKKPKNGPSVCYKDTVDIAIEKAEACLRKIREIKQSFL